MSLIPLVNNSHPPTNTTNAPTQTPTVDPTNAPTQASTADPTNVPTRTQAPTADPTKAPTKACSEHGWHVVSKWCTISLLPVVT